MVFILLIILVIVAVAIVAVVFSKRQKEEAESTTEASYFEGGFWHYVGLSLGGFLVCLITLGIAFPWVCCWFIKWRTDHTVVNGKRLQFTGKGISLFGHFLLKGWLLGLILGPLTLGLYWIYYFCVSLKKWEVKNTSFKDN
ncbi:MAG: DUF898 domain-containing protein [Treponema sp.]|nr:DUF898 domain-containing protein [Treponema sp.]